MQTFIWNLNWLCKQIIQIQLLNTFESVHFAKKKKRIKKEIK